MQKDVVMPEEAANLITKRIELWRSYDEASQDAQAIEALKRKLGQIMKEAAHLPPKSSAQELTDNSNPPDELGKARDGLEQEIAKIKAALQQIGEKEAEIGRLKNQKNIIIGVSIIVILVVAWVAISSMASMFGII